MNFFRQIMQKPWEPVSATPGQLSEGREFHHLSTAKLGLRVFLAVVTVLFLLLAVFYIGRMAYGDWRAMPEPWLLWVNTGSLVASSIAFQYALMAADRGRATGARDGLLTGGVFALLFLGGQLLVWRQLVDQGFFAEANPANGFFYVVTGLHALHLLGGLVAWGRTFAKYTSGMELAKLRLSIELSAQYWHFLLLVWLLAFGLLIFT